MFFIGKDIKRDAHMKGVFVLGFRGYGVFVFATNYKMPTSGISDISVFTSHQIFRDRRIKCQVVTDFMEN